MNLTTVYKTGYYSLSKALVLVPALVTLNACTLGATMPQQFTVMATDCKDDDMVQISDEMADLNGDERWTARCDGRVYDCIYSPDAGASCYQRKE